MRILAACSLGGAGHLRPLVPLLAAARRRGDEVLVVGPPALTEVVERAGFPFRAGGEPPEVEVAPIRERLPVAPPREAAVLGNRDLFGRLAATAMLPGMEDACATWSPDLVLRDPCEYSSAVVADRLGIPAAQVAISLAEAEANSIAVAAPAIEEHRTGLAGELLASPYLTRFPASIDPSPFPSTIRFREPDETSDTTPPAWWSDADSPRVYMTFGTVLGHMSVASAVYRTALRAVTGLDVRVLLTVGHRFDPSELDAVPANVRVEGWVDQDRVLGPADLVVCHGGSGTVLGTLAAGRPLVIVPVFGDQFENARRVARAGAGVVAEADHAEPAPGRRVVGEGDVPRIADAIVEVLATPSYRRQAERLGAEMAAVPTAADALAGLSV